MKIQVHINKTSVSVKDRGFNYGDGIFETIRVKNNKCLYQIDHINRLIKGCKILKISSPSKKLLNSAIKKVGGAESLNVSVSAGVILHKLT